mmetsp:Transcript_26518/g.42008  ORF Transcript_26518/g.42008 Transcript_26518/m.42008 type:complete len:207 (+) Transcript_26518:10580-11200(+)
MEVRLLLEGVGDQKNLVSPSTPVSTSLRSRPKNTTAILERELWLRPTRIAPLRSQEAPTIAVETFEPSRQRRDIRSSVWYLLSLERLQKLSKQRWLIPRVQIYVNTTTLSAGPLASPQLWLQTCTGLACLPGQSPSSACLDLRMQLTESHWNGDVVCRKQRRKRLHGGRSTWASPFGLVVHLYCWGPNHRPHSISLEWIQKGHRMR